MSADVELPEPAAGYGRGCNIELSDGQALYTGDQLRACVAHATAAKDAEIEALRAKAAMTMGVGAGDGKLFVHGDYESIKAAQEIVLRAERLAEALRELVDLKDNVKHSFPNDYAARKPLAWDKARALLRDQEDGRE